MKRIVVGTDFSSPSLLAVRQAATLTHRLGGELFLVHAGASPDSADLHVPEAIQILTERSLAEREARLAEQLPEDLDISVQTLAVPGYPVDALCNVAEARDADLVVVGSHGRTGLSRAVLGSIAEGVVRRCTKPVMVARSVVSDLRRILLPTDFSLVAELAIDFALSIAAPRAEIELLHAWDPPDELLEAPDSQTREYLEAIHAEFERRIAPIIGSRTGSGAALQFVTVPRAAVSGILSRAEEISYDCVVMGTQGQTGLKALITGSVAQAVVRHAPCSVIVVPPPWRRTQDA